MTTTPENIEPPLDETVREPVTLGGLLRRVDVDSGRAEFKWAGADHPLYFDRGLAPSVQSLEGKYVQVEGIATFNNSDEDLIRIDLESIRLQPGPVDWQRDDWPPPFNRDALKPLSFDFDVDEFIRGIYAARRKGVCSCDKR